MDALQIFGRTILGRLKLALHLRVGANHVLPVLVGFGDGSVLRASYLYPLLKLIELALCLLEGRIVAHHSMNRLEVCASSNASSRAPIWPCSTKPSAPSPTVHVFVLCRDGTFYEAVPVHVRKQGPWQGMHRGDVDRLKPEYRLALARDGYALVQCELAVFKPEVCST